jgi:galactitol-specific phosphotransferase system IIB component
MKILILCDKGINRSHTLASRLKWVGDGHDILTAGIETNDEDTLLMLQRWADVIIITDPDQEMALTHPYMFKCQLWNIGPDKYPRPYNKELLAIVTKLIADHPEYSQKATE